MKKNFWLCLQEEENTSPCEVQNLTKNESHCTALLWYLQTVFLAWNKIIPTLYKHENIQSELFKEYNRSSFWFQLSCTHVYTDVHRDVQQPHMLQAVSGWWWWGGISRPSPHRWGSRGRAGPACLALHRTGTSLDKWDFSLPPYYPFLRALSFRAKLGGQLLLGIAQYKATFSRKSCRVLCSGLQQLVLPDWAALPAAILETHKWEREGRCKELSLFQPGSLFCLHSEDTALRTEQVK